MIICCMFYVVLVVLGVNIICYRNRNGITHCSPNELKIFFLKVTTETI